MVNCLFATNSLAGCFRNTTAVLDGDTTAGRFVNGVIDGVRQYNRVLGFSELARLYAEPYAGVLETAPRSRAGSLAVANSTSSYVFVNT